MATNPNRVTLEDGNTWIELKPELTYGDELDILDASQADGRFSLRTHALARICAWVRAWSLPDAVTPEAVAALRPALGRQIAAAVNAQAAAAEPPEGTPAGEAGAPAAGAR